MNNTHINKITAVTQVRPEGQKCVGVLLAYDCEFASAVVTKDAYSVEDRTILSAQVCTGEDDLQDSEQGSYIYLALSPDDDKAVTYFPGEAWEFTAARVIRASVSVAQVKPLTAVNGTVIPAAPADENDAVKNPLVDEFVYGSFEGLAYNLFIPKNYDPNKKYPLVQFIHDAGVCSPQHEAALAQGVGALVWMTSEAQKRHECFVLAPQFAPPTIVDDDWNVDHRLEVCKRLLDKIVSEYSIDPDRLYTTGQSMGCMSSMVLNLRYPDLFAASLFVAGQWDERLFKGAGLQDKKFWFINSQGDAKAFPGMNQITYVLEQEGAKIAREVWRTGESQETYATKAQALIATGANMIYTPYEITTVANGWSSHGGEHHINTWRHAYFIEAIQDWLFDQHR